MRLISSAFEDGSAIPRKYTCQGDDVSPPLSWSDVPSDAGSLALVVDDPDAPDPKAPKRVWVHWILFNIPIDASGLAEAIHELPAGSARGKNDWGRTNYGGPCPPVGRHRYFFKLYALDGRLDSLGTPTKAQLLATMEGHVLAECELMGTYEKS